MSFTNDCPLNHNHIKVKNHVFQYNKLKIIFININEPSVIVIL